MRAANPVGSGILERLQSHARSQSASVVYRFLRDDQGAETVTFGQLDRRVRSLAAHLREHASPGDRALLIYPSGIEFIEAFLGCLAAGIIAVPAYPPRRNRNAERLRSIFEIAGPRLVLSTRQAISTLDPSHLTPQMKLLATDELELSSKHNVEFAPFSPDAQAFLQFTSGSTGTPRGVIVTHGNIVANEIAIQAAFGNSAADIGVSWLPPYHDMGLIGQILQPLFIGAMTVFMSPVAFLREPIRWLRAISDYGGTTAGAPNFAYDLCVERITSEQKRELNLRSWRVAYNGAEPVRPETMDRFARAFSPCGFRPEAFLPCYGLAEATLIVSGGPSGHTATRLWLDGPSLEEHRIVESSPDQPDARQLVSSGKLADKTHAVVVDPQTCIPCPAGSVGEIWVKSPSVAAGYWNAPEETAATFQGFLTNQTGESEGPYLRTGDAGFLYDGELFIAGRLKDLIIIRGRNLYPQDIESAVERALPIATKNSVAAFAIESPEGERLAVVIEADRSMVRNGKAGNGKRNGKKPHRNTEVDALIGEVRQVVSDEFEVLVSAVAFVRPGSFPRTSSGKVQRSTCRSSLLAHELDLVHFWQSSSIIEPKAHASPILLPAAEVTPQILRDGAALRRLIHDKVLQWRAAEGENGAGAIDYNASLMSLGIDSIGAASIVLEIERATGVPLSPEVLYECRTIEQLAQHLETMPNRDSHPYANGIMEASGKAALLQKYARRADVTMQLKKRGRYFFETTISEYDGARVKVDDHWMLMFSSYSYLGLIGHPEVNEATRTATERFGVGCHGARLIAGTADVHRDFEREIADFVQCEDAVVFNTGYVANLATVSALVGEGDCVIGDEYNHASIVDGARFSGAQVLTFRHNDIASLEEKLRQAAGRAKLVVVDGVYSMEGDIAPLPDIVKLCERYSALLMVDEAHSLGVLGARGRGVQEHFGLPDGAIDVKMGTLSKSLGSCGGYIASTAPIIEYLKHAARGFLFSVAAPVPLMAAALQGLRILRREPERVARLQRNTVRFITALRDAGFRLTETETPIVPILCEDEERTISMTARCREEGLFIVPVVYPAVPMNAPRVRASVMVAHTDEDIDEAVEILVRVAKEVGLLTSNRQSVALPT